MAKPVFFSEGQLVDEAGAPLTLRDVGNTVQRIAGVELTATANFDFQNIPQTYKHLEILIWGRTSAAAATDSGQLVLNNDNADANFFGEFLQAFGNTASAAESIGAVGSRRVFSCTGATAPAGMFNLSRLFIPNYARSDHLKQVSFRTHQQGSLASLGHVDRSGMTLWNNVAAINRIGLVAATGTGFVAGSYMEIFGWRSGV